MCEINPKHSAFFRLEAYTSDSKMSKEDFTFQVVEKLLHAEMALNSDMRFRFHIHEEVSDAEKTSLDPDA